MLLLAGETELSPLIHTKEKNSSRFDVLAEQKPLTASLHLWSHVYAQALISGDQLAALTGYVLPLVTVV